MKDRCEKRPGPAAKVAKAAEITRSGARRYPGEIVRSLKDAHQQLRNGTVNASESCSRLVAGLQELPPRALAATWLGHATVLLRVGGLWILTDPVFSRRIGVNLGAVTIGPERLAAAPVGPEDLPPIDAILLSHAHFDHLDKPSLRRLINKETLVITAPNTRGLVPRGFKDRVELGWDREFRLGGLAINAIRPAHWGTRFVWDRHRGFNSYVITADNHRILYAGDSAMTDEYQRVRQSFGGCDLAVFGIGAYDPWIHAHATPEQVWEMSRDAGAEYLMPMHHSTFKLSNEPLDEPLRRLHQAAGESRHRIVAQHPGEIWVMPASNDDADSPNDSAPAR